MNIREVCAQLFLSLFRHMQGRRNATHMDGRIMVKLGVVGGFGAPSVCLCFLGGAAVAGGPQKTC